MYSTGKIFHSLLFVSTTVMSTGLADGSDDIFAVSSAIESDQRPVMITI